MLRKLLPRPLRRQLGKLRDGTLVARARRRSKHPRIGRPHGLPAELIVSLTSYPARFATLHLTLGCLLDQTVESCRTILWVAYKDTDKLPPEVRRLEDRGLEIRTCDDLRSFKKLIPALETFPDAFIATADDDLYYRADWLEELVQGVLATPGVIACHRAHRMKWLNSGEIAPYQEWEFDVQDDRARQPTNELVPIGVGGVIYPPHSLDPRVTDGSLFERLCPHGDDLWFAWCARMVPTMHKKVGSRFRQSVWPGTQSGSLWERNETGGNDAMIAALQGEYAATLVPE